MNRLIDQLVVKNDTKIVFLIMDGVGGLEIEEKGGTELQVAHTPNLDKLAESSLCGLLDPILPGITPGSGPSHFALFGYDPIEANIGRGILEAAGINFPLTPKDVVARINYCTIDKEGKIIDRRAGRISTEDNYRLCKKIEQNIKIPSGIEEVIVRPVKEHRAILVLRGDKLAGDIEDTDPQMTGVPPLPARALSKESESTADLVNGILSQIKSILSDEPKANMLLLRGFARYRHYPSIEERYKMKAIAIAVYPMYKGIARLLGMDVVEGPQNIKEEIDCFKENFPNYDFFYIHIKQTDSRGEDGDFDAKVKIIEEVDSYIPEILELNPDVIVVTGDHSTPSLLKSHSWHPLPVLIHSSFCRRDMVKKFDEISCAQGALGRMSMVHLMSVALANARRLIKFGA